ncbi:hypothetical protein HWC53_gp212 [Bacillus phage vB_BmeM-Goe8]|uniref:Pectate lyase superfamily protein domain-containing protein n=1 Tax=Bacillus phage vB_BmeM-Goe8 TaxID=2593638 RepID=A0A516KMR4_9CAUD|nr:hypothetical protein HWC53_gp212 [Bacillus phage vB_BmeM-Goe8]QDP42877.1 hypothetical protein Goe8_c01040 [Bacillus phage vB_BmeM-Goe8]
MSNRPLDRDSMYFNLGDATAKIVEHLLSLEKDVTDLKGTNVGDLKAVIDKLTGQVDSQELNAKYPPVPLVGLTGSGDETATLDNILSFAKTNKYSKVFIPKGTYTVKYVKYRDGISIQGAGLEKTIIKALASTEKHFMQSVDSPTQQLIISDLSINGNLVNAGQNGLGLIAYPLSVSPYHGGVWYSVFRNLRIEKFKGAQIIITKGADELAPASLPNQFNIFENIQAYRAAEATSYCLYMENQIGQHTFRNCGFDCPTNGVATPGTNIYIDGGNTILFDMVTSQNSEKVYDIKNNLNTTIRNGWIENSKYAITTYKANNLNIEQVNFANACSDGSGGGYGVKSTDTTDSIVVKECNFRGNVETSIWGNGQSFEIKSLNNKGTLVVKGIIRQISAVDNLSLSNAKFVYLSNQSATVNTLNHNSVSGELITVKFHGPGTTTITNSGNIKLPNGVTSIIFQSGDTATFTPTELESGLMLVAHNRVTPVANKVTSLPTADVNQRGRIIRTEGGTGVADAVYICIKKADDTYDWAQLY